MANGYAPVADSSLAPVTPSSASRVSCMTRPVHQAKGPVRSTSPDLLLQNLVQGVTKIEMLSEGTQRLLHSPHQLENCLKHSLFDHSLFDENGIRHQATGPIRSASASFCNNIFLFKGSKGARCCRNGPNDCSIPPPRQKSKR